MLKPTAVTPSSAFPAAAKGTYYSTDTCCQGFGVVDSADAVANVTELLMTDKKATFIYYGCEPSTAFSTLTCLAAGLDMVLPQPSVGFTLRSTSWELTDTQRSLRKQVHSHDCDVTCLSWLDASTIGQSTLGEYLHKGQEHTLILSSTFLELTIIYIQGSSVAGAYSDLQMRWNLLIMLELPERVATLIAASNAQCVIEASGHGNGTQAQNNRVFRDKVGSTVRHITNF